MLLHVVFDTNIWIAGLIWRGDPYRCLLLARGGIVQIVFCQPMAGELAEKLRDKFRFSANDIRAVMYELNRIGERVEITGQLRAVPADADDDKFVECAVVAGAQVIVSEDRHLLDHGQFGSTNVLTAYDFLVYMAGRFPKET